MHEWFNESGRRVLAHAKDEAERLASEYLGTEHLLLGILMEDDALAAAVLKHRGITTEKLREMVTFVFGQGAGTRTGSLGLTPRAKTALELAFVASRRRGQPEIGPEHLLLGLTLEDGTACGLLDAMGASCASIRADLLRSIDGEGSASGPEPPGSY